MEYRANRNIVFSCKFGAKVLVKGVDRRLEQIIAEVADQTDSILLETEVMADHVHLLIDVDRNTSRGQGH